MKLSRSLSSLMRSMVWPVCLAIIALSAAWFPDVAGMDVDIGRLALKPRRLVDHDLRVRQRVALAGTPPASNTAPIEAASPRKCATSADELHGVVTPGPHSPSRR